MVQVHFILAYQITFIYGPIKYWTILWETHVALERIEGSLNAPLQYSVFSCALFPWLFSYLITKIEQLQSSFWLNKIRRICTYINYKIEVKQVPILKIFLKELWWQLGHWCTVCFVFWLKEHGCQSISLASHLALFLLFSV